MTKSKERDEKKKSKKRKNVEKLTKHIKGEEEDDKPKMIEKKRKPRRLRPGTGALREIRKEQKKTNMNIKKLPLRRIVKRILELKKERMIRIQSSAFTAIHEDLEDRLHELLTKAYKITCDNKRTTLTVRDMRYVKKYAMSN